MSTLATIDWNTWPPPLKKTLELSCDFFLTYLSRANAIVSHPFAHPSPLYRKCCYFKKSPQTNHQLQNRLTYVYYKFELWEHVASYMHAKCTLLYFLFDIPFVIMKYFILQFWIYDIGDEKCCFSDEHIWNVWGVINVYLDEINSCEKS